MVHLWIDQDFPKPGDVQALDIDNRLAGEGVGVVLPQQGEVFRRGPQAIAAQQRVPKSTITLKTKIALENNTSLGIYGYASRDIPEGRRVEAVARGAGAVVGDVRAGHAAATGVADPLDPSRG